MTKRVAIDSLDPYIFNSKLRQEILSYDENEGLESKFINIDTQFIINDFKPTSVTSCLKILECIRFWNIFPIPFECLQYIEQNKEAVKNAILNYHREPFDFVELKIIMDCKKDLYCLNAMRLDIQNEILDNFGLNVHIKFLKNIIMLYPDGVKVKDSENGYTLLHIGTSNKANVEIIRILIEAYPDAVKEKDEYRYFPLHLAAEANASIEVINLLIEAYPDAVTAKGAEDNIPIHLAAYGASIEVVIALLKAYPDGVKKREDDKKIIPLHIAAESKASVEVLNLLIKKYPYGVIIEDEGGNIPLHYAIRSRNIDKIIALLKAYPEGIKKTCSEKMLPLHIAIEYQSPLEIINLLLESYPEALKKKDNLGCLPIHIAIENYSSLDVINALLKLYPDGAKVKDRIFGRLPLHYAIRNKVSSEIINVLHSAYPVAIYELDKNDKRPYDYLNFEF